MGKKKKGRKPSKAVGAIKKNGGLPLIPGTDKIDPKAAMALYAPDVNVTVDLALAEVEMAAHDERLALRRYRAKCGTGGVPADEFFADYYRDNGGKTAVRMRSMRISRKLTQGALAKLLGMPQSNISQMEKGKRPITDKTVVRLAEVLQVDSGVFLPASFPRENKKSHVSLQLDADVVVWLKSFGPGYKRRINDFLKALMWAHRSRL